MLRVVFFGTAELACASLNSLAAQPDFQLAGVVTQPDRPKGRDMKLQPTPVKQAALNLGLPVHQPLRARDATFIETLAGWHPDLIVVAAYGQILPPAILDLPRFGCLNVHTSLLPKFRGAAPIQWALLEGEMETGVTIMKMDAELDTGDIVSTVRTPIKPEDNAQTLHDRLARLGAELLVATIPEFVSGKITPRAQPAEGATYARKISKEDGLIDWQMPARAIWNRVRAFTPWPGAYTFLPVESKKVLLKLWQAEVTSQTGPPGALLEISTQGLLVGCGMGALRITSLQKEGGRRMSAAEFLAGHRLATGVVLG